MFSTLYYYIGIGHVVIWLYYENTVFISIYLGEINWYTNIGNIHQHMFRYHNNNNSSKRTVHIATETLSIGIIITYLDSEIICLTFFMISSNRSGRRLKTLLVK